MKTPNDLRAEPRWPLRLIEMCGSLRQAAGPGRDEVRTRLWILLRDGLLCALRRESSRHRSVTRDDLEDLASAKALDLLARAERGDWDPAGRSPGEVVVYLRSTARNGLIRLAQQRERSVPMEAEPGADGHGSDTVWSAPMPSPERQAESREFASGLIDCLARLQPRSRCVWVLRAVHDLSSRDIAAHPDVGVTPANVDVILMRTRALLQGCLETKGLTSTHLPAGTFALLWDRVSHGTTGVVPFAGEA